ncbi:type II toxin-antitoxin system VapC family toxin [Solicola gregarius]|uniref:Ribonuclease VapC n=1 Tax=Solicola gregarius TaxID=2908642 RepID=A0AA46TH50_9ACTN|nr:type II toxin-antitoxin system VapC family toxin [Solicola gregarius]UYM05061.1 type II toxin-antitoxin system VapC family toxin [Solicola gregarius]
MLHVLDSTVLIDYLRGRPAVERLRGLRTRGDVPATTAVNVEEIVRGVRMGEVDATDRLFAGLIVLPVDPMAGRRAGAWRREFARQGVTLWQADCLIAATAAFHNARLVTGNPKDFPMAGLAVEHWPVGE